MNFEEHAAKPLAPPPASITTPRGILCLSAKEVGVAAAQIGPCVVKAQVPTGKRGKAGGIRFATTPHEAETAASQILGMRIGNYRVEGLLVEEQAEIVCEFYAAILPDTEARKPLILFCTEGGMDIEEIAVAKPQAIRRVVALDCKFVLDGSAIYRQGELAKGGAAAALTPLETRGADAGLKLIQLDGNVGVLANGAGLTMTTMDVIRHYGGKPANFLEIGGEAYTKSEIALDLVLSNPRVKSVVINFCGSFARTDVMANGVVKAWRKLKPKVPVFFSIHGTGEEEAIKLVREQLSIEPYEFMEDAIQAAVKAAQ